jgi:hypothetical protein
VARDSPDASRTHWARAEAWPTDDSPIQEIPDVNRREALAAIARLAVGAFAAFRTRGVAAEGGRDVGDTGPARFRCRPLISGPLWWFDARQSAE